MNKLILIFLLFLSLFSTSVWSNDYEKAEEAFNNGNYELAVSLFYPLAKDGNISAMYAIGYILANGFGEIEQNFVLAEQFLSIAAQEFVFEDGTKFLGHPDAQHALSIMYSKGEGVPQDFKKSVDFMRQAASQGHDLAQYNLGQVFNKGLGVEKDYKEAVKWYTKAAEKGRKEAQYNLGTMYAGGRGVKQDDKAAFKWFKLAAEQGLPEAQINLSWTRVS